jgi:signal transduction histidine kinase/methyl-accepting chemotaxis protein
MSSWLRNLSIGHRLIIIVTVINLVVLVSIGLIAFSSNRRALESQSTRRFAEKNQQVTQGITDELDHVMTTVNQLQTTLSNLQTHSQERMRATIRDIISQDNDILIHRVSVYLPSELIDGEASDDSVVVFQILAPRTGVINETRTYSFDNQQPDPSASMFTPIETNQPIWFMQDVAYADVENVGAISLAVPYELSDQSTGVIWVDIPQPIFDKMVSAQQNRVGLLSETMNGFAMLINKDQALINSTGERADSITSTFASDILANVNPDITIDGLNLVKDPVINEQNFVAIDLISLNGWKLVSILPQADIPTSSGVLVFQLVIISVVGIVAMIIAVNHFTRSAIVAPLLNLSRVAQEIGSGDLRFHIDYRELDDEIGYLARAMEGMKSNISSSTDELRTWSRTLEERVYERTKQLNATRKEAEDIASELRAVYDESLVVVTEPTLEPILEAFTHRILSLMEASYCSVWLLDDAGERLRLATNTDNKDIDDFSMNATEGMVGQSISKQTSIVIDDYTEYSHRAELPHDQTEIYERAVAVPLMFDGTPRGAVFVGRKKAGLPFDDADTRRLTLFANLVSPAVRNAQLYNQRESARREAERANQVKTRFLASVTHELRTPLNLVINNIDFMRIGAFGDVTEEQLSRLNQTVRSAELLLYLINDLLDVSKIEAGEMQMFIQPTNVQTIIEDSIDSTYALMEKYDGKVERVTLTSDIDKTLPKIPIDARRIRQVITNLLSNAVKFTHDGEVKLTVKAGDDGIYFAVSDTGIGVPEEEMSLLFEAFERTTEAKEQNIEGTGLGLPISQFLVQQHGGILKVTSVSGEGATFMFTLPYTISTDEATDSTQSITPILKSDG